MFRFAGSVLAFALFAACSPSKGSSNAPGDETGPDASLGAGGVPGTSAGGTPNQNQGGDPVFIPGADGGSEGKGGSDAGCAGVTVRGEELPLDIYIMFDQSASMSCSVGATDRWTAVKTALKGFVQDPGAATIHVGLGYFGTAASPPGSACSPADYRPDVEIGALATNAPNIVASLDAHNPLTDTPTLPAIKSAISHAIGWKGQNPTHTVVVVLVTDGEPNACGANTVDQVVAAAEKGFTEGGVATYVIGIVSPGQTCTLDPNQPNGDNLNAVAKAGGTDAALIVDTTNSQQDAGQQFLGTMNKIRQNAQIPCEYSIPPPPEGEAFDYKKVNVGYTDPQNQPGKVYFVDDKTKCDPAIGGGWFYGYPGADADAGPNPKPNRILLCPTTCSTVTGKFGYQVNVQVGCKTEEPAR